MPAAEASSPAVETSSSCVLNLPLALLVVAALLYARAEQQRRRSEAGSGTRSRKGDLRGEPEAAEAGKGRAGAGGPTSAAAANPDRWRQQVQSTVVAAAWETLCGSIVQEVRVRYMCLGTGIR